MPIDLAISGLTVGCIYSLIALAFSLIFRATGLINFAQGELVMLGAMLGFTFLRWIPLPFALAFLAAVALTAVVSLLIEKLAYRPIRRRHNSPMNAVIGTIGVLMFVNQVALLIWDAQPLTYPQVLSQGVIRVLGFPVSTQSLWILALGLGSMLAFHLFFKRTRTGQAMRASADDPLMAQLVGVNIDRSVAATSVVGGALGGAAGVLLAPIYYVSFDMGIVGLKSFAAAILGGFGSIPGAMVGGLLLGEIETFGSIYISSSFKDAIAYALIILILLIKPSGLFGVQTRRE